MRRERGRRGRREEGKRGGTEADGGGPADASGQALPAALVVGCATPWQPRLEHPIRFAMTSSFALAWSGMRFQPGALVVWHSMQFWFGNG